MKRKLLSLVVMLCLLGNVCASAEGLLFPQMDWADMPVEIRLSATVTEQMPFDEVRLGWLNDLLKHVSLVLRKAPAEDGSLSQASVQVDGSQVVGVTQHVTEMGDEVRFNVLPGVTYAGSGETSALCVLPGFEEPALSLYGLDGTEGAWLAEGEALIYSVLEHYADDLTDKASRTTINGFTTAQRRKTLTIAKADAEAFREQLIALCPEGKLETLLESIVFGSKMALVFNTMNDGTVIRMNLTGRAGTDAAHLRQVDLTVRMLHRDDLVKDAVELKSPTVNAQNGNYDTVTLERKLTVGKKGEQELTAKFTYKRKADKKITTTKGEAKLTRKETAEGVNVLGKITLENDPPQDKNTETTALDVDLTFHDEMRMSGSVSMENIFDGKRQYGAVFAVEVKGGSFIRWEEGADAIAVAALSDEEREAEGDKLMKKVSAAILRPLVLLPREETYYLSYDLPDDVWQQIVDAAKTDVQ